VGGHADQVADGQAAAAAGVRPAGGAFEFVDGGGGHDGGRNAGDLTEEAGLDGVAHVVGFGAVLVDEGEQGVGDFAEVLGAQSRACANCCETRGASGADTHARVDAEGVLGGLLG
jgi:hypothetical protein